MIQRQIFQNYRMGGNRSFGRGDESGQIDGGHGGQGRAGET